MNNSTWSFSPRLDPTRGQRNPFEILGLPLDASNDDIVARVNELIDTAATDEERLLFRTASEELVKHPLTRVAYEMFEMPGTQYRHGEWERFQRMNRRPPVDVRQLSQQAKMPQVEDFNLGALLEIVVDGLLDIPEPNLGEAVRHCPFEPLASLPLEVRDVIFG